MAVNTRQSQGWSRERAEGRPLELVAEAALCYIAAYDPPECDKIESLLSQLHFTIRQASQCDGLFKGTASRERNAEFP